MSNNKRPSLLVLREVATEKISSQLDKGNDLLNHSIGSQKELESISTEHGKWRDYTEELLRSLFDSQKLAEELVTADAPFFGFFGTQTFQNEVEEYNKRVGYGINSLESILGRLDLFSESIKVGLINPDQKVVTDLDTKKVFIVHGHDNEAKETVARLIEKIGLEAIILHEQANKGQTIIEKIEAHSEVGFAIVLLTPDDMGYKKNDSINEKARARQNVIFEMGYFIAKLGRERVAALYKGELELPTDYQGILYTEIDIVGHWRYELARELKASGIDVDMNKI